MVRRRPAGWLAGVRGEESAGASFLRRDGTIWTTDKDGMIAGLLAAEITAVPAAIPGAYAGLTRDFGSPIYERIDAPATAEQKRRFKQLAPDRSLQRELAGETIRRS